MWCTQKSSSISSHPTQAARLPKNLNSILAEGSTWDLGELWHSERDQVGVPGSVQKQLQGSHTSLPSLGESCFPPTVSDPVPSTGCSNWSVTWHCCSQTILGTFESPPRGLAAERTCLLGTNHTLSLRNWLFVTTSGNVMLPDAPERCPMRQAQPTVTKNLLPWDTSSGDAPLPNSCIFGHTTIHFPDFPGWVELSPELLVGKRPWRTPGSG